MIRVRINVGQVGIVTRKGDYRRVLTAGVYFIGLREIVTVYDMAKIYKANVDFNIMVNDKNFRDLTEVINVKDDEIVIQFNNDNLEQVLTPGKYFYWKGLMDYTFIKADLGKVEITEAIDRTVLYNGLINPYVRSFTVETYEEGLLFVDGNFVKKLLTGNYDFWKNTITVEVMKVDLRQLQLEISGQEILTKDKAALRLNFFTQYKVVDTAKAIIENKDFEKQLYILIQLALREYVGTLTLDELLENKQSVTAFVMDVLKLKADKLGVVILDAGIRDIILPGEVKDIMNQVMVAQKKAQANTITRREETASTRSLLNTAKLMEENDMLFKLKEMEYVEKIADKIGELTVSGSGQMLGQLKDIFSTSGK